MVEDDEWREDVAVAGLLLPGATGLLKPCLVPPNIWIRSPTILPEGELLAFELLLCCFCSSSSSKYSPVKSDKSLVSNYISKMIKLYILCVISSCYYLFDYLNRSFILGCCDDISFGRWIQHAFSDLGTRRTCINEY